MASTLKDLLPLPSSIALRSGQARRQSTGQMLFTNRPDPALNPRRWLVSWGPNAHGAGIDVIRRHYDDHAAAVFTLTLPRTAEVVSVRWLTPPQIQWNNAVSASVTGEVEEALAHE